MDLFNRRVLEYTLWCAKTLLIKRGYKHRFVKDAIEKAHQIPRSRGLETSIKQESHRIPFVETLNPALQNIRQVIFNNLSFLRSSKRCLAMAAFCSPPCTSYRRFKNLRDILVKAKHYRQAPLPESAGSFLLSQK